MKAFYVATLAAIFLCSHAHADTISGKPVITDGDTIRIGTTKIRIKGMDASVKSVLIQQAIEKVRMSGEPVRFRIPFL